MSTGAFALARQVDRVPSMIVPLDRRQERRFEGLLEAIIMIDLHQHPMVLPGSFDHFDAYLRGNEYEWGYKAARHGGWTAICTANAFRGMAVDVSHAGPRTAMEGIEHSRAPISFSHNAAYTLRPTRRTRKDEELVACARKGGLIGVTAVPNSLSDAPDQDIQ